jgi:signal transduction histidine kinase
MTANSDSRVTEDDVARVAALLFIGDGTNACELAARFASMCQTVGQQAGSAALLGQLTDLGLVRISRHGDSARYFLTPLGQQHARATLAGQPELTGGLGALERLRTDVLSTVAHEVRTPLTALRTSIGVLLDPNLDPEPALRQELLHNISQSADRMQRLITEVLDLTRLRLGGVQLQLRRFDAVALAREVGAPLLPLLESRRQVLELDVPGTPVWVYGDHRRLDQALNNLLSNAHKFSPNDSTIRLTVRADGLDVTWSVADDGLGIAPEDRPRLFERFFSAATDAAGQHAGTGLGLPLALAIAQAHGGTIEVQSVLGRGSKFTLRVPAAGPPEEVER